MRVTGKIKYKKALYITVEFDEELAGCRLGDDRLDRRLRQLVKRMQVGFGERIPLACQDWAGTKVAYRCFSNERVSEGGILRCHFDATRHTFAGGDGPILVLHDTTVFSWRRKRPETVGFATTVNSGRDKVERDRLHSVCGLLMHSSLAVTTDGLPLGMVAVKFWKRKKIQGTAVLKKKVHPTRLPIVGKESMRWLANLCQSTELLSEAARCSLHQQSRLKSSTDHLVHRPNIPRVTDTLRRPTVALSDEKT